MEFPTIDEFAKNVAEKVLDEIIYGGEKTIREWIEIIIKQQPCDDAISRQAVLEIQASYAEYIGATKFWEMLDNIRALPPVTPQPKIGHWIDMSEGFSPYECSECRTVEFKKSNYCPNCGAKMVESEE